MMQITIRKTASVGKTETMMRNVLMPGVGEQIHARTQERDAMFGRMAVMAPLSGTAPSLLTGGTLKGTLVLDGRPLEAIGGLETRKRLEETLAIYSNIGPGGATPDHQWRAAEHFRPFYALDALTQTVEAMIREAVAAAVLLPRGTDAGSAG